MERKPIVRFKNIGKSFSGNKVLEDISFSVDEGEIVALCGENGAGKSTLMNILFGMSVIHTTGGFSGEVEFDGTPVTVRSPKEAMALGIGMVHQEFMLIPGFTVARNIKLNRENVKNSVLGKLLGPSLDLLDTKAIRQEAEKSLMRLNMKIDPDTTTGALPVGYKQFVEIAREIDKTNLRLLVLDEPTAVLTESEAAVFLKSIRQVADRGIAVIFISHRLDEVLQLSDRVVIMRDGRLVFDEPTEKTSKKQIAELMVGREMDIQTEGIGRKSDGQESLIMTIEHLKVDMPGERSKDINLTVRKGEILGIGGLAGHGKTSIANAIFGMYPSSGTVTYKGKPLQIQKTGEALSQGIAFVSEDRKGVGLLLSEPISLNVAFTDMKVHGHFLRKVAFFHQFDEKAADDKVNELIRELDIRCTGPDQLVGSLSGGNQQKVCVARALATEPELLLVSEPTRGIDIGAKQLLLNYLKKLNREKGLTIVMTSSELNELKSTCDRIAIVTDGRVAGILPAEAPGVDFALLMSGETLEGEVTA